MLKAYQIILSKGDERDLIHWDHQPQDFFYEGDLALTKHVLFNLIKNALWAMERANKGKIKISFNTAPRKFNELIFKDTGCGIPQDIQKQLFTQFHSTQATGSGTGVGLMFCRLVMEAYGGKIACRSVEGEYTTFILSFPKF